jgi:4a-hydroxytetrahydrobiopterin dehydratase
MTSTHLSSNTCVPCQGGAPPLTFEAASTLITRVPRWELSADAKRLFRRFVFEDFAESIAFVNRVAEVAESQGHHPDIEIHWNLVELTLWTHKIGGLHENDFVLAARIDDLQG